MSFVCNCHTLLVCALGVFDYLMVSCTTSHLAACFAHAYFTGIITVGTGVVAGVRLQEMDHATLEGIPSHSHLLPLHLTHHSSFHHLSPQRSCFSPPVTALHPLRSLAFVL